MSHHNTILYEVLKIVPRHEFDRLVVELNGNRIDYQIYERLFYHLLGKCHPLSNQHMKFPNPIFSMDATLVSVCHALIPWATYRTRKGAIKIHVLLSHQNYLPEFLSITDGNVHEIHMARALELKPDSILLIDRGYIACTNVRLPLLFEPKATCRTRLSDST